MCIATKIKTHIEKNGFKQAYIADKAGIRKDALCTTLLGKRKLPLDEYCKICVALNVPFNFFIDGESNNT